MFFILHMVASFDSIYIYIYMCVCVCVCVSIVRQSQWPHGLRSRVNGRSPAVIVGSNPTGGMDVCVVFCQVEVSATS
jgi:hypothetical protein